MLKMNSRIAREIEETTKAYFAAIFDISAKLYNDFEDEHKPLTVEFKEISDSPLMWMQNGHALWGGTIVNDTNTWILRNNEAEKFLFDIRPYMLKKFDMTIASMKEIARFWNCELYRCFYCNRIFDNNTEYHKHTKEEKNAHKINVMC